MGAEVAEEASLDGGWQNRACEAGHRLSEVAVFSNEEVIMGVLQVERVEDQLHPCRARDEIRAPSVTRRRLRFFPTRGEACGGCTGPARRKEVKSTSAPDGVLNNKAARERWFLNSLSRVICKGSNLRPQ